MSGVRSTFYTNCGQITNSRASSEEVFVDVLSIFGSASDWLDSVRMEFGGGFRNAVHASVGNMRAACFKQVPTRLCGARRRFWDRKIRQR